MIEVLLETLKIILFLSLLMATVPWLVWMERKGSAFIQDRMGPRRASIFNLRFGGIFHPLADAIKLLSKEEVCPTGAYRPFYFVAPVLAFFTALLSMAVIPLAEKIDFGCCLFNPQIIDLRSGLIYVLAISSFSVHAVLYAGWGSNNRYSILGALRSSAQLFSFEVPMLLAALSLVMVAGSFGIRDIVMDQGAYPIFWNMVRQPIAFLIFFVAMMAHAHRLPFDLPDAEAELVSGYHVEYSSQKFSMFLMAEYINMFVAGLLIALLFLGGWLVPFVNSELLRTSVYEIILFGLPLKGSILILIATFIIFDLKKGFCIRGKKSCAAGMIFVFLGLLCMAGGFLAGIFDLPLWILNVVPFLIQIGVLLIKAMLVCAVFIWIKWTLPRFRYDQIMRLGWMALLPLGVINLVVTAIIVMYTGN